VSETGATQKTGEVRVGRRRERTEIGVSHIPSVCFRLW